MGMLHKLEEKQSFYDELKMHSADDLVMCMGDFNGHTGRHIDGFNGVHGEYGAGHGTLEGTMLFMSGEGIMCQIHDLRKRKVTF